MLKKFASVLLSIFLVFFLSGCASISKKNGCSDKRSIEELTRKIDDLTNTKNILEEKLSQEIQDKQVKLNMLEGKLVITFVADILFDSGKDQIRKTALIALDKVALVLNENVPDLKIGIEGHTDNQPIKRSGWKSNWELSTARALSVLHYLSDEKKVSPDRLSAIGYGEYYPVPGVSNDTKEGRQLNRRVEIVIMPSIKKVKEFQDALEKDLSKQPKDSLK